MNEIDPNDKDTWFNKGVVLGSLGLHEEALECFGKIIKIDPNDINSLTRRCKTLEELKNYKAAIKCYDKVLQIYPNDEGAFYGKERCQKNIIEHRFSYSLKSS